MTDPRDESVPSNRVLAVLTGGVLLVVVGLVALRFPVLLDAYDKLGIQIDCGTGYLADLDQAGRMGPEYVDRCHGALLVRRLWAIPLAVAGWLLLSALVVSWMFAGRPADDRVASPSKSA
ncbi:hypothetical protein LV457_08195 [Mycobacterium sp. MYCO198283]|uniref:hypothetical protein n=1 Tax=Mycobacterium sp. MYCO198283 TaxID=2883505 RepID=UPI001E53D1B2|nr:hypothetical protein [Mycobacterium sp. MYCO198283]MCG5432273.1 hypothetical protein [Mycobacterium sp. MYCO198283]